jgi:hypothetical protein
MCLLLGAPGVGKTLLVKRLQNIFRCLVGGEGGPRAGEGDALGFPGAGTPPSAAGGSLTARTAELSGWHGRPGGASADAAHGRCPPRTCD